MRVMFVDDEPQILRGICRTLDSVVDDWEIETATSGQRALELLAIEPVDILVSDMRMPGMDGAELLTKVSDLYPNTVRIVLSGQVDKEAVFRAISPMHQYLSKPCDADTLRETIARAFSLSRLLESTGSHQILGRVADIPSLPDLYQKVVTEFESDYGTVEKVGQLISQDPAMTARVLQLANSAIFGLHTRVNSPGQAAGMIGMDALKSLVLSLQVFKSFSCGNKQGFSIESITDHSLRVASMARHIASSEGLGSETTHESFTAGLLHDVGKLILMEQATDQYVDALQLAKSGTMTLLEAEKRIFDIGHDGVGGYLLSLWGLPQSIVEGVAFHHSPGECVGTHLTTPAVVCIANHVVNGNQEEFEQSPVDDLISKMHLEDRVAIWRSESYEGEAR